MKLKGSNRSDGRKLILSQLLLRRSTAAFDRIYNSPRDKRPEISYLPAAREITQLESRTQESLILVRGQASEHTSNFWRKPATIVLLSIALLTQGSACGCCIIPSSIGRLILSLDNSDARDRLPGRQRTPKGIFAPRPIDQVNRAGRV